jgi:hypothetical protein
MKAEDHGVERGSAKPFFIFFPIHATLPGAEPATLEDGVSLLYPLGQLSLFFQFRITGPPFTSIFRLGIKRGAREEERTSDKKGTSHKIPTTDLHIYPRTFSGQVANSLNTPLEGMMLHVKCLVILQRGIRPMNSCDLPIGGSVIYDE